MGDDTMKVLIIAAACLIGLFMILPIFSSAAGVKGPEMPGIPGVVGKPVCDLVITVYGIWNHIPIPGWMDEVKITDVRYTTQNWRYIMYSMAPLGWSEGDGEMMIKWSLEDTVGNPIQHGELKFTGTQTWTQTFQIYKVEPGGYKLKIEVWMNTKFLTWNEWVLKDSRTIAITITAPS
ncbi:MAG: hypothetical protein QXE05_00165 [Nitrososphaeria archaeon]